ncbi:futalosine hydrolase [Paenibacillus cellulosilyticus]|uniref:Futalosine hydrolase n=1 Tax=Paenibacillus cellulosilyticus TaxID=375489 RepID=A0A2V2Z1T9_9BACL|nr:futalosine hydrolase [Paenibacillus cellulosilyticus]PWW02455.1 futalosine hydrolase [Paenibacillus cellulosilyticus]QKS47163.1 futalosine hydrolase [Paenibacillus cellulosilyticus]
MGNKILIVTAVDAERDAVLRGLEGDERFVVIAGGVGPAIIAASTAAALTSAAGSYRLVISAGIGGGFDGQADIGDIVVSTGITAADLGAETPDGERFLSVDELGFGSARVAVDVAQAHRLTDALFTAGMRAIAGQALTVSTATGSAEQAARLAARVPGAASEGMEGYGVAAAAQLAGIPVLELRAISNRVGPRDKSAWRIGEALGRLAQASAVLKEVF